MSKGGIGQRWLGMDHQSVITRNYKHFLDIANESRENVL